MPNVTVINPFEVPQGKEDETLKIWDKKAIQLGRKFGSWLVIGITLLAACSASKTDVRKLVEGGATAMNSYDLRILFGQERLLGYQSPNGRQWGTVCRRYRERP